MHNQQPWAQRSDKPCLVTARQLGADYPFDDAEARKWFNFYGRLMYGLRLRKA